MISPTPRIFSSKLSRWIFMNGCADAWMHIWTDGNVGAVVFSFFFSSFSLLVLRYEVGIRPVAMRHSTADSMEIENQSINQ